MARLVGELGADAGHLDRGLGHDGQQSVGGPDAAHQHYHQTLEDQALRIDGWMPASTWLGWQRQAVDQGQQHQQGLRFDYHGSISSLMDSEISMIGDRRDEITSSRLPIYDQASSN